MKIHFLPTIWSDAEILEYNGKFAIVDTGGVWQEDMIRNYLKALYVSEIEFILLTHFHPDHYGCLEMLVREFNVNKVYFKQYSGVTKTDGTGKECSDAQRKAETENCRRLRDICSRYSQVIPVEGLSQIPFCDIDIKLYNSENTVYEVFSDENSPLCGQYACNENQNSLMAFFEIYGRTVLLTGDITDFFLGHPKIDRMNTRFSKEIGRHIDIYKAPHHGYGVGTPEALAVYTPSYVYFTNSYETVIENTQSVEIIKSASPDSEIFFASDGGILFTIKNGGSISHEIQQLH